MNLVIVGVGKVGGTLVETLIKENHDIVVVDVNAKQVENIVNKFDVKGIVGGGCDSAVLMDAGIASADFFIACTSRDEFNILCCVLAKRLGAKHTVCRVRDPEYFKEMHTLRDYLGIDLTFNPEYRTAVEISQVLKFPSAKSIESFARGRANMVEFDISENNPIIGKTLVDVIREYSCKILFAMVKRKGEVIIPRGNFVIEEGDTVHIIASDQELSSFCKKIHIFKSRAKSVFIVGGGKIAYYLAKILSESGVSVKIMENNEKRCVELSDSLPGATVLFGDGTDQETLSEENFDKQDACVILTGMDEENAVISLYAKQRHVAKVITKIDRKSVADMISGMGLDTLVSPQNVIANHVLRFVRAHQTDSGSGVNTLYKLSDKAEALEFTVKEDFPKIGVPLKELQMKQGVLVGGIVRGNEFILPVGDSTFEQGDKVLVVSDKGMTGLSEMLQ